MTPETLDPAQFHLAIGKGGGRLEAFALWIARAAAAYRPEECFHESLPSGGVRHPSERKRVPMSKLSSPAEYEDDIVEGSKPSRLFSFLPYLLILALTLVGVGYTSISKSSLGVYWEVLAVITGLLCIISGWPHAHNRDSRMRLVWTQVLHWAAFLAIMVLLLHTDVSQMLTTDSTGLAILLLLALGTFVAGVHTLSWQTCVLGAVEALAVPAIAWIEESALLLVLASFAFIVLAAIFWWFGRRRGSAGAPV